MEEGEAQGKYDLPLTRPPPPLGRPRGKLPSLSPSSSSLQGNGARPQGQSQCQGPGEMPHPV